MKIGIIPIGTLNSVILRHLTSLISDRFNTDVEIRPRLPIETFSKDDLRNQYPSSKMLEVLSTLRDYHKDPLLGVVDGDLFVPTLNFVFGEANLFTKVAVISVTRLEPRFYGYPPDKRLLIERAGKEAVHELGHIYRLDHCRNPQCVMFFSNSIMDTDRKSDDFCTKCKNLLNVS